MSVKRMRPFRESEFEVRGGDHKLRAIKRKVFERAMEVDAERNVGKGTEEAKAASKKLRKKRKREKRLRLREKGEKERKRRRGDGADGDNANDGARAGGDDGRAATAIGGMDADRLASYGLTVGSNGKKVRRGGKKKKRKKEERNGPRRTKLDD